ncbi:hypothetical protein FRC20_007433 [Serendipita sp. 405]|nr:hypothetical protein FRC20_007433 [Serendipita sp. 405]
MPHHDLESTIPGERLYNPESRNPLGTQFKSSFGRKKGSPASPSTATRASLTSSLRPQPYDNKDLIHREESIQHREAINAPKRLGRLKESF